MKIIRICIAVIIGFPMLVIVFIPCLLLWGLNGIDRLDAILDFWADFVEKE